jgi:hypothetical protein
LNGLGDWIGIHDIGVLTLREFLLIIACFILEWLFRESWKDQSREFGVEILFSAIKVLLVPVKNPG